MEISSSTRKFPEFLGTNDFAIHIDKLSPIVQTHKQRTKDRDTSKAIDARMDDTDDEKAKQQLVLKTRLVGERATYFRASREGYALTIKFPVKEKEKAPVEQMKTATINFISDCEDEWLAMSLERRPTRQEFVQRIEEAEQAWLRISDAMKFIEHFAGLCSRIQFDPDIQIKARQELEEWHKKEEAACKSLLAQAGLPLEPDEPVKKEPEDEEDEEDESKQEPNPNPLGDMALVLKQTISYISMVCTEAAGNKESIGLDWMGVDHVLTEFWKLWCTVRANMQTYSKVFR